MHPPQSLETPVDPHDAPPPIEVYKPTPLSWRLGIAAAIAAIAVAAFAFRDIITVRGQAVAGVIFFFGIVAVFSANLRAVNWQTIFWGIALQAVLAVLVLKVGLVHQAIEGMGWIVQRLLDFVQAGSKFVFGNLYDPRPPEAGGTWSRLFPTGYAFQFAFVALPPILFFSAMFTVLYHFGILQRLVKLFAKVMLYLMRTSGAETLSVAANVFMGQTEAPLIVRPYVPRMTNSELFVLMASGMAHISGGLMAVYISYGANPVAVITTCVMACPCSLYLSKLFLPEVSKPETGGQSQTAKMDKSPYVNSVDACAAGTSDGLSLALNVAAMLIVFIAFVAMFDAILASIRPLLIWIHVFTPETAPVWMTDLSLSKVFGWIFSPVAFLMGVVWQDASRVGSLLGTKLAINEHVAFLQMKSMLPTTDSVTGAVTTAGQMSERSFQLAAFALTGFANFSSVGIQLGGIGGMAPNRRHDLARLGMRALFVGFTATLLNASIAGILLPTSVDTAPPPAAAATATGANQNIAIPTGDAIPEKSEKSTPAAEKTSPSSTSAAKSPSTTPSSSTIPKSSAPNSASPNGAVRSPSK
ncbi:MAG TPA: nucleoside transporter C-terminal domain-containing protein [Pirellulales bacterium]|jgi:CNT family concentrative nucleoside transporter